MIKYFQHSAGFVALALAIAAVALLMGRDAYGQTSFFTPCIKGLATPDGGALTSTEPNANADIFAAFGIGIGEDCERLTADDQPAQYNSAGLVTFTPAEWFVANGEDIPDGDTVGEFSSFARLGLINNSCANTLPVNFTLIDGSIDRSNTISPNPPGTPDRLRPLALDGDNNGIPDGAERWPDYLTVLGDPDHNNWDFSKLRARFMGINAAAVSGTVVILNFLVFEPGTVLRPDVDIDEVLGYAAVTVLQDPTAPASNQDPVSDFCAPLYTNAKLLGKTSSGVDFRKNPGPGHYFFTTLVVAAADAEADGIENALDTCPYSADPGFDPRADTGFTGDEDRDGIPNSCDPFPNQPSRCTAGTGLANTDEDCDGWQNRGDNCPLDKNEDQADEDSDQIGDVCDREPGTRSGTLIYQCLIREVIIGDGSGVQAINPADVRPCNPEAPFPYKQANPNTPTPAPPGTATAAPRTAGTSAGGSAGGVGGGVDTGIGSLSPTSAGIPLWATVLMAIGGLGLLAGTAMAAARRRR